MKVKYSKIIITDEPTASPLKVLKTEEASTSAFHVPSALTVKGLEGQPLRVNIEGINTEYVTIPKIGYGVRDRIAISEALTFNIHAVKQILSRIQEEVFHQSETVSNPESVQQATDKLTLTLNKRVYEELSVSDVMVHSSLWRRGQYESVRTWDWLRMHSKTSRDGGEQASSIESLTRLVTKRLYDEVEISTEFFHRKADHRAPVVSQQTQERLSSVLKKVLWEAVSVKDLLNMQSIFKEELSDEFSSVSTFLVRRKDSIESGDISSNAEHVGLTFKKPYEDTVGSTELLSVSRVLPRSLSDEVSVGALITKQVNLPVAISVSHLEGFSVIPNSASGDIFGAQEDIVRSLHRLIAEHIRASDLLNYEHEKGGFEETSEDTQGVSERLSYRMQNYVVDGYFASTYVGEFKDAI